MALPLQMRARGPHSPRHLAHHETVNLNKHAAKPLETQQRHHSLAALNAALLQRNHPRLDERRETGAHRRQPHSSHQKNLNADIAQGQCHLERRLTCVTAHMHVGA